MKLTELLAELSSSATHEDIINVGNSFTATPGFLKTIEQRLFECDELKNVVRINYLGLPTYLVDKETGEPINVNRNFLGGETTTNTVVEYGFTDDQEIKFNKIVDLYSISLVKTFLAEEDIKKPGVWVYPTTYDETNFISKNQIRVIWEPSQIEDALRFMGKTETVKDRILRMFHDALDSMEPNVPCKYYLQIRCSARSISTQTIAEIVSNASYTGATAIFDSIS